MDQQEGIMSSQSCNLEEKGGVPDVGTKRRDALSRYHEIRITLYKTNFTLKFLEREKIHCNSWEITLRCRDYWRTFLLQPTALTIFWRIIFGAFTPMFHANWSSIPHQPSLFSNYEVIYEWISNVKTDRRVDWTLIRKNKHADRHFVTMGWLREQETEETIGNKREARWWLQTRVWKFCGSERWLRV